MDMTAPSGDFRRASQRQIRAITAGFLLLAPIAVFASNGTVVVLGLMALLAMPGRHALAAWLAGLPPAFSGGLVLLLSWALVSAAWAPGPALVPTLRLGALTAAGLLVLAAVAGLSDASRRRVGGAALLMAGALLALLAAESLVGGRLSQYVRDLPAPTLDALNRASAVFAPLVWPATYGLGVRYGRRVAGLFLLAAAAVLLYLPMFASFVALVAGGLVLAVVRTFPRRGTTVLLAAFVAYALAAPVISGQFLTLDMVRDGALPMSWKHRVGIWEFTSNLIAEHPLRGAGFEAARHIGAGQPKLVDFPWVAMPLHPHNLVLQVWLELGAVGLAGVILILAGVVAALRRATAGNPARRAFLAASLATFLFIALMSYGVWQNWWLATGWLVAAVNLALVGRSRSTPAPRPG